MKYSRWEDSLTPYLVGGWTNPSENYDRQNGNLPQIGIFLKENTNLKPPPIVIYWLHSTPWFSNQQHTAFLHPSF